MPLNISIAMIIDMPLYNGGGGGGGQGMLYESGIEMFYETGELMEYEF